MSNRHFKLSRFQTGLQLSDIVPFSSPDLLLLSLGSRHLRIYSSIAWVKNLVHPLLFSFSHILNLLFSYHYSESEELSILYFVSLRLENGLWQYRQWRNMPSRASAQSFAWAGEISSLEPGSCLPHLCQSTNKWLCLKKGKGDTFCLCKLSQHKAFTFTSRTV